MSGITGRIYYERGLPVTALARWRHLAPAHPPVGVPVVVWLRSPGRAPRNVLVGRADGTLVIRPFRGLRKQRGGHHVGDLR